MTLEVISDINFELSGLNKPCFSAYQALMYNIDKWLGPSFIPGGPSFGQSALSLVRTADLVWTEVRLGAFHRFRALSRAVSGTRARYMSLQETFKRLENQPTFAAAAWGISVAN